MARKKKKLRPVYRTGRKIYPEKKQEKKVIVNLNTDDKSC